MSGYTKTDATDEIDCRHSDYITPYSMMFSYRKSKIKERRESLLLQSQSDILQTRILSGLQVPTADESLLHSSRRTFDTNRSLSTQRYRRHTAAEDASGNFAPEIHRGVAADSLLPALNV